VDQQFGVRGSMHRSTIHKEKIQQDATMYKNFIIPYLYEAQHVSGDTPLIISSLNCTGSLWFFFIRGRLLDV
jgi:hypothetical protein